MTIKEAIEQIKKMIAWAEVLNSAVPDLIKLENVEEALTALEAAEQQDRRNGKWKRNTLHNDYRCSICGEVGEWFFRCCPNCGAKMEVEK